MTELEAFEESYGFIADMPMMGERIKHKCRVCGGKIKMRAKILGGPYCPRCKQRECVKHDMLVVAIIQY